MKLPVLYKKAAKLAQACQCAGHRDARGDAAAAAQALKGCITAAHAAHAAEGGDDGYEGVLDHHLDLGADDPRYLLSWAHLQLGKLHLTSSGESVILHLHSMFPPASSV